jgi:hypothetical protein
MIDLKNDGDIAIVTVRHGKANALDIELCEGLTKCFEELRRADARAVVVTGQGRMFSAGVDLIRVSSAGADYVRAFLPSLHRLYDAVFFYPKPVVGRDQRSCHRRRLRACLLRRPPHHGAGQRPYRDNRVAGRRAVSGAGF